MQVLLNILRFYQESNVQNVASCLAVPLFQITRAGQIRNMIISLLYLTHSCEYLQVRLCPNSCIYL